MGQKSILFSSTTELAESIMSGKLTSYEVVTAFFEQIDNYVHA